MASFVPVNGLVRILPEAGYRLAVTIRALSRNVHWHKHDFFRWYNRPLHSAHDPLRIVSMATP